MACHVHMHGENHRLDHNHVVKFLLNSAEVVAGMVAAEIRGESWTTPGWLPRRFLTFIRDAPEDRPIR